MSKENDVVFLATPAGVSAKLSPQVVELGGKVIDLSGDFRLESGDVYQAWYKHEPAPADWLKKSVYGLTEWNHEQVAEASLIANPGCYPTATLLALIPLAKSGWVDPRSWIVDAKSGVSGAGRGVSLGVHYSEINESIHAYKVGKHQHTPEIEQEIARQSGTEAIIQFTPHLVPMTRGILVTAYGQLTEQVTQAQVQELLASTYADKPFVRVRPAGSHPRTKEVYGSNYCDIAVHVDERTQKVILLSVIDNMVKGAAGQAIHNMNIMLGLPETMGLPLVPVFP
jgi:N-acetyl-gamma-glutamyl-phosphate reductase